MHSHSLVLPETLELCSNPIVLFGPKGRLNQACTGSYGRTCVRRREVSTERGRGYVRLSELHRCLERVGRRQLE